MRSLPSSFQEKPLPNLVRLGVLEKLFGDRTSAIFSERAKSAPGTRGSSVELEKRYCKLTASCWATKSELPGWLSWPLLPPVDQALRHYLLCPYNRPILECCLAILFASFRAFASSITVLNKHTPCLNLPAGWSNHPESAGLPMGRATARSPKTKIVLGPSM